MSTEPNFYALHIPLNWAVSGRSLQLRAGRAVVFKADDQFVLFSILTLHHRKAPWSQKRTPDYALARLPFHAAT